MNKIFLTQDGEVLRVQKRGQILLTLTAKENGNSAVLKRWDDVEDLRVTATIPNVSGAVRLPHTFDGSDMTIAAHYEWHDCNVMVIGNLGGVPFEYNIELKVDASAAETTSAIVEVPALDAGGAGGSAGGGMVEVTHAQLKAMRDAGQLVAGQQYRITDYVATTTDPESRSANHPFDIIVTADNERTLNESARAIAHEGDTYFEKCNLAAWRLQYCIDNDTSRFAWAKQAFEGYQITVEGMALNAELVSTEDTTHEGYLYRLLCDFQGITLIIYSNTLESDSTFVWVSIAGQEDIELPIAIHSIKIEGGKGVVYRMIDENNNDIPYDFKGIKFKRYKIIQCDKSPSLVGTWAALHKRDDIEIDVEDFRWCYLFNVMFDELNEDDSVGYYLSGTRGNCAAAQSSILINGVCNMTSDSYSCYGWTCGNDCYSWTCGNNCYSWTCGNNCYSWTCGNYCYSWTCGNTCYSWTCGNTCSSWTCGNDCYSWTCGNDCYSWTCGNYCSSWTCGNTCSSWTCSNYCYSWTCGNNCYSWTCGNDCYYWTCGNDCYSWTCGNDCSSWTCGNNCSSWTCGNTCSSWTCGNYCSSWTCGNTCYSWTCGNDCSYFKILDGTSFTSNTAIPFVVSVHCQVAGKNSSGTLKVWTPADLV